MPASPALDGSTVLLVEDESISCVFAYLVIGGFSHGRFVETLFAASRAKMLRQSPTALFLAH